MGIAVVLQGARPNYEVSLSTDVSIYGNLFQDEVEKSNIECVHLDRYLYHVLSAVFYKDVRDLQWCLVKTILAIGLTRIFGCS